MRAADQDRVVQTWIAATEAPQHSSASPDRKRKIERLRDIALLRLSGRADEMIKFFSEDCEFYVVGGPQFSPFSGRFHGREQILDQMNVVNLLFEFVDIEFISVIVENDDVAIRWKCQARQRRSGPSEWLEGMSVVHFDGDLINYYGNFLDTGALVRLVDWPKIMTASGRS